MKFSHSLLLASMFFSQVVFAEDVKPDSAKSESEQEKLDREVCENTKCQKNVRIKLTEKNGKLYDRTFNVLPGVIQDFGITVYAGQTVFIEAEVKGKELVNLKAVDSIVKKESTITIKFEQIEKGGMMLSIQSPFKETIKFNMGIMPLGSDRLLKTSSCPVMRGSYEMWQEPIFQIVLANPKILADSDSLICSF
jgi:hypothetical protein